MKDNIILDKSKAFALRIIKLYRYLRNEKNETVMSKQLLRIQEKQCEGKQNLIFMQNSILP